MFCARNPFTFTVLAGLLSLAAGMSPAHADGIVKIVYPAYEVAKDTRFDDLIEILKSALEKTVPEFGPYELAPSKFSMNEARYLLELKSGQALNVAWSSTSEDKERELLPLRIPLRKGLLGYRIALIARDRQDRIDRINTLDDLRKLTVGQGIGWGDVRLYESNGITVTKSQYASLFKMVAAERFDLFPRGIGEIFDEYALQSKENPNLAIEKNLLIYYPWPYYFFFNRKDAALQRRIEAGIRKMMKDGSFDEIFWRHHGSAIAQADLRHRRVIRLKNDMLPKDTPLDDASLWLDPSK